MKLILVRHGQTIKNRAGLVQGNLDSALTDEGLRQVMKVRDHLKGEKIDAVFCSSLGRASNTAKIIVQPHNCIPIVDPNLDEINWGDYSTLPAEELLKKWAEYYKSKQKKGIPRESIRPPNGENSFDHAKRIKQFLNTLLKKYCEKTILVIAHSGTNKVIVGLLKNLDPDEFYSIKQDNACINILELDNSGKLIRQELNITEHLSL